MLLRKALIVALFTGTFALSTEAEAASVDFDAAYYLNRYDDVSSSVGWNFAAAESHYRSFGIREGRSGSPVFDPRFYLWKYPDLQSAFGTDYAAAYAHWMSAGIREGRSASPIFDPRFYLMKHPDLWSSFGADGFALAASHFVTNGQHEGRASSPFFDASVYLRKNPDVAAAFGSANYAVGLVHYLKYVNTGRLTSTAVPLAVATQAEAERGIASYMIDHDGRLTSVWALSERGDVVALHHFDRTKSVFFWQDVATIKPDGLAVGSTRRRQVDFKVNPVSQEVRVFAELDVYADSNCGGFNGCGPKKLPTAADLALKAFMDIFGAAESRFAKATAGSPIIELRCGKQTCQLLWAKTLGGVGGCFGGSLVALIASSTVLGGIVAGGGAALACYSMDKFYDEWARNCENCDSCIDESRTNIDCR